MTPARRFGRQCGRVKNRPKPQKEVNSVTVTIHLKGGVKQTYLETAVMDDVEARRCVLASGVTTGNRRNLQGRERNHYGFAEDSHIAYDWRDVDRIEIAR